MRILPVNLANRPIEQVRRLRRYVTLSATVLLSLTAAHAYLLGQFATEAVPVLRPRDLPDGEQVERWRMETAELKAVAEPQRVQRIAAAAAVASELIAWQTLPWGALFSALETALPERVRLETVQPVTQSDGSVRVSMIAAAADPEELQILLAALEAHAALAQVFPTREETGPDGLARLTLEARYLHGHQRESSR